ncbi:hypothetical protein E8E14_004983 [Neopestalotiopsis sp. 37M]|nr:hypothetical protein E8E14_004983 [Neopestalotiopsis sp. 37M]
MTKNKNSAEFVFTTSINHTGWTDGIAWCVGQLSSLFAFFSLDTATHFAEETPRREITVPRVKLLDSDIGFLSPFTKIIYQSTGSPAAAIMINGVSTWTAVVAVGDLLGASARIIWSLGRDEALPERWGRLSKRWHVPIPALLIQLVVVIPVAMIYIWNGTAFYGVMGATVVCFQISYFMPIALKVFRYNRTQSLLQGPWKMGRVGFIVDIIPMCFGAFMIIFMSFPMVAPVTAENMNYACVIVAAACVFAGTLWFCYARHRYEAHISVLEAVDGREDNEVVSVHKAQHKNVEFHA